MKRIMALMVLMLFSAGVAQGGDYEVQKKAGDYEVKVSIDRNPPIVGDNNVTIQVMDKAGKSVTDAKIKVDYSMPPMPGMPPMNYKTNAALKGDVYQATLGLSMGGSWNVTVAITREGKTSRLKFTVDAR